MKQRFEGEKVPMGWSFTDMAKSGGRIHLNLRLEVDGQLKDFHLAFYPNEAFTPEKWSEMVYEDASKA